MLKFSGYSRLISCQCSEWPPGPVQGSTPSVQRRDPRTATYSGSIQVRWQAPVFPASVTTPPRPETGPSTRPLTPMDAQRSTCFSLTRSGAIRKGGEATQSHQSRPTYNRLDLRRQGPGPSSPPCATHGVLAKRGSLPPPARSSHLPRVRLTESSGKWGPPA